MTTSNGQESTLLKCGDVFLWEGTNTYWIIYLQYLEEKAYFMASIRRCDQTIELEGRTYRVYICGPMETSIPWNQKSGVEWNDMNYSLVMYITKTEDTLNDIHRFSKLKITEEITGDKKTWQVVGVNPYYGDGIIEVYLDEFFENSIEEAAKAEAAVNAPEVVEPAEDEVRIDGPEAVAAYDEVVYTIVNKTGGTWSAKLDDEEFLPMDDLSKDNSSVLVNYRKPKKLLLQ
jgi:hypothetical protein